MSGEDSSLTRVAARAGVPLSLAAGARALAATVVGREDLAQTSYQEALRAGVPPSALLEVAAMSHLFGGFPRAIQGLRALAAASEATGVAVGALEEPEESRGDLETRGRGLFEAIYGSQTEAVLAAIQRCLPGFERWILQHAYGRVLSRPGLGPMDRELLAVAALAVLGCESQLLSHARGALRVGASKTQVLRVLESLADDFDAACLEAARRVVQSVG